METANLKPPAAALPLPPPLHHRVLIAASVPQFKQIHAQILRSGLDLSAPFISRLLALPLTSSPCSLDYSLSVLLHSPTPDFRLANRSLRALARAAEPRRTLAAYGRLRRAGLALDRFSFPTVLRAAARARGGTGTVAWEVHGLATKTGLNTDPFVQTAVVGAYAALGQAADARVVFDRMAHRDLIAWSVMLDG